MALSRPVIHLVLKTHLDLGFTDFAKNIERQYLEKFLPQALELAEALNREGKSKRFTWTTGSYLIFLFLEKAEPTLARKMERAIVAGDIVWHALPFTFHSELLDASLFEFSLSLSRRLDDRFGKKTISAKMTDVPGHTRGIVPLLADAGVQFLHLGCNPGSTPPDVPPLFRWRDSFGKEITVMFQKGSYGGLIWTPNKKEALNVWVTDDNRGLPTPKQIDDTYRKLQKHFPRAQLEASDLNRFAGVLKRVRHLLPVLKWEIGDSWIHGAGSDPTKVRNFRELLRLRRKWLKEGIAEQFPAEFQKFSLYLMMVPEHTWGLDVKKHLRDYKNYNPSHLTQARKTPPFQKMERSWREQRAYLDKALSALPPSLGKKAKQRLKQGLPVIPNLQEFDPVPLQSLAFETGNLKIRIDAGDGSITELIDKKAGKNWADEEHKLGVYQYEVFGVEDYIRYFFQYNAPAIVKYFLPQALPNLWQILSQHRRENAIDYRWLIADFTKPGMPLAVRHRKWKSTLEEARIKETKRSFTLLLRLTTPKETQRTYGNPAELYIEINIPKNSREIALSLRWFQKNACRLPEAIWVSFTPKTKISSRWTLQKMGRWISPKQVISHGGRSLHAVDHTVRCKEDAHKFVLETWDAPLVAPGGPSLLHFENNLPEMSSGVAFNLYNNLWGTNFPMWFDEDALFRFTLRFS